MIRNFDSFAVVAPRQDTIAKDLGVTPRYVNKIIARFVRDGILGKIYRHMTSCIYKLTSLLYSPVIRNSLAHLITSFLAFPLVVFGKQLPEQQFLQYIYRDKCINKKSYRNCKNLWGLPPRRGGMEEYVTLLMYQHNPLTPAIRDLPFSVEEKVKLSAFNDIVIEQVTRQFKRYRENIYNPYRWFFKSCLEYCDEIGVKPNWDWSYHLATMIPIFKQVETDNKSKKEKEKKIQVRDKSVRTESTAIAAQSISTDTRKKESLKQESLSAPKEGQGFADDHKPKTSLFEAASLSKELQENLRRLGVKI